MSQQIRRSRCTDCLECQMCTQSRCHLCRKHCHMAGASQLGPFLTHGEYLEWRRKKRNPKICHN